MRKTRNIKTKKIENGKEKKRKENKKGRKRTIAPLCHIRYCGGPADVMSKVNPKASRH